jgi:quinol---cytochrome c reductase cytochrome c subunit, bacillus type
MAQIERRLPEDAGREIPVEMEKTYRLLALVRGQTFARPKYVEGDEVMVWPDLVVIEAVAALVFTLLLLAMSVLVNAPLLTVANPTRTPNPSKAPWYFLNLQELLLHMDAGLAGVFVPGGALVALAAIPYIDRSPLGQGVYWYTPNSKRVAWFSAIYTTVLMLALIIIDEPPRIDSKTQLPRLTLGFWPGVGISYQLNKLKAPTWLYNWIIPVVVMLGLSALLVYLVKRLYNADTREVMIALFTGFVVSYVILTISGTAFRGHGMELHWPWENPRVPEGASVFLGLFGY